MCFYGMVYLKDVFRSRDLWLFAGFWWTLGGSQWRHSEGSQLSAPSFFLGGAGTEAFTIVA